MTGDAASPRKIGTRFTAINLPNSRNVEVNTDPVRRSTPWVAVLYTDTTESPNLTEDVRAAEDLSDNARTIRKSLRSAGFAVHCIPFGNDIRALAASLVELHPEIVFNLAEAPRGDYALEPDAAGLLQLLGLKYTGNGPLTLALCKNKALTKQLLLANRVPTPRAIVCEDVPNEKPSLTFPVVVKPLCQDGSFGITDDSVANNQRQLARCVAKVLEEQRQPAFVEEFVGGREFNVSVLGNGTGQDPYRVLPPGEYVYHSPRWRVCTFKAKWDEDHPSYAAVEAVSPARTTAPLRRQLERWTLKAARLFALAGYARLDFRLDSRGTPHLLDINPNPDLAPRMGLARAAETAGIRYPELLSEVIRLGLAKGAR